MAKLQYRSLSMRTVDGLSGDGKDIIFWDRELPGFGVRVYPSGAKVYLVQSRGPGGSKRVTVGRHGVISADRARRRAASIIARIKAGEEPKPPPSVPAAAGPTVAELAERYLSEHVAVHCKPITARAYRKVIGKHILPVYGKLAVTALGREHVAGLHYRLRRRRPRRTTLSARCHGCSIRPKPGVWFRAAAIPAALCPSTERAGWSGS